MFNVLDRISMNRLEIMKRIKEILKGLRLIRIPVVLFIQVGYGNVLERRKIGFTKKFDLNYKFKK